MVSGIIDKRRGDYLVDNINHLGRLTKRKALTAKRAGHIGVSTERPSKSDHYRY